MKNSLKLLFVIFSATCVLSCGGGRSVQSVASDADSVKAMKDSIDKITIEKLQINVLIDTTAVE